MLLIYILKFAHSYPYQNAGYMYELTIAFIFKNYLFKFLLHIKKLITQEAVIKTYRISFILCTSFLYTILNLKVLFNKIYNQQQSDLTTINYFDRTLHN